VDGRRDEGLDDEDGEVRDPADGERDGCSTAVYPGVPPGGYCTVGGPWIQQTANATTTDATVTTATLKARTTLQ